MAEEALNLIRKTESTASETVDRARIDAARNISDAKAKAASDLNEAKNILLSEKEQAIIAAKELANEKANSIKDAAKAEAERIIKNISENKLSAKEAVLKEIL